MACLDLLLHSHTLHTLCFIHLLSPIRVGCVLKAFRCTSPLSQEAEPEAKGRAGDQKTVIMFERK